MRKWNKYLNAASARMTSTCVVVVVVFLAAISFTYTGVGDGACSKTSPFARYMRCLLYDVRRLTRPDENTSRYDRLLELSIVIQRTVLWINDVDVFCRTTELIVLSTNTWHVKIMVVGVITCCMCTQMPLLAWPGSLHSLCTANERKLLCTIK
jgi:hypothetical protein